MRAYATAFVTAVQVTVKLFNTPADAVAFGAFGCAKLRCATVKVIVTVEVLYLSVSVGVNRAVITEVPTATGVTAAPETVATDVEADV